MNKKQMIDESSLDESEGWFSRLKRRMGLDEYEDDEYEEEADSFEARRRDNKVVNVRVHTPRPGEISVWVAPRSLADAQSAADRLKERRPVIINLERTDDEIARRVVDFISGVTYAVDGYYQRIGAKVFLFTPSNTTINVEDDIASEQNTLFFDQR